MAEIEELRNKLAKQEKLASLGLLSAGVIHEIQNPLNFVINFSKMSKKLIEDLNDIIEDNADNIDEADREDMMDIMEDLKQNIQKISEHGDRAINIVHDMLLFSRGKENEWIPTDVSALTEEFVRLSYHANRVNLKDFNSKIVEEYPEEKKTFNIVPKDFGRAILNIVNNAFYAIWERSQKEEEGYNPSLIVKVDYSNGLVVSISDNGCGMSEETKQKLFENFYTTKPAGQGTGLGMGIVRQVIVDLHKGSLDIESQEGVGTTIKISIPNA